MSFLLLKKTEIFPLVNKIVVFDQNFDF